jgi:PAS domain S-box-containing protein
MEKNASGEIKRLQGCINDLISILALSGLWSGRVSSQMVKTLLDGLVGMLRLEFAHVRLNEAIDGAPIEVMRLAPHHKESVQPQVVSRVLDRWLTGDLPALPVIIPSPVGEGEVAIAAIQLGLQDNIGVLVAASERRDFPTQIERLLLRVAANQAAVGLQEARRLNEQKRAAKELEQRVEERTSQLTTANQELCQQITERKRVEEERLKLASMVENSADFIGLATLEGHTLFVNPAGQKLVGLDSDEEVRATWIADYVVEEDQAKLQQQILPAVIHKGRWDGEIRFRHFKTGAAIPMLPHVFVIKEPGTDHPVALATISRDITERKRAEGELLALKDELAAELMAMTRLHELSTRLLASPELQPLLDEVLDATIALQNADFGLVQLYNPETRMLDLVAHRGFDADFAAFFKTVDEHSATSCGRALRIGERVIIEDVQTDPNFAPYRQIAAAAGFRAVQSTLLFSRSGAPLGVLSTQFRAPHRPSEHDLRLTDLYARQAAEMIESKRTEEALRASEARFRRYFELGLIGMAMTLPTKGIFEANDELCLILGYERSELLQKTWVELTHPDDLAADVANFERVLAGQIDGYSMDKRWIGKDGRVIDSIMAAKCLRRADGSVDYFVGLVQDITERKRNEEALRKAQAELAHVTRLTTLGEMTASIAHEVNQPLGAIVTNGNASLRLLAHDTPDIAEVREAVDCMISDAMRASQVIKRIRTLLRKTDNVKTLLHINETIREVISMAANELASHQVALRTELAADLPPLMGDRVQLQQVLLNLTLNANEAMSGDGWQPRELLIRSQRRTPDDILVSVRDTGTGLQSKTPERVFDAFYTTKESGLGLGLSISRTIIEAHGGRLWATPNKDQGTTMQFTLSVGTSISHEESGSSRSNRLRD